MNTLKIKGNTLCWTWNGQYLKIIPWGKNSLRVISGWQPDDAEIPGHALMNVAEIIPDFYQEEEQITISNGNVRACVDMQGRVTFYNQKQECLLEEMWRQRDNGEHFWDVGEQPQKKISALKISARECKPLAGDAFEINVRFESNPAEKICGMGQYQQPFINLKGCAIELAQRNSQASVPFMVSSLGYGFLWNNPAVGEAIFACNETRWHAKAAARIDYWITAGDTPQAIIQQYAEVSGKPPLMPEFALGLWQSKLRYRNQEELLAVARRYRDAGIPLAVIVADFFHWPIQGDWRFDEREWPDPAAMTAELRQMGTELMVSVWPTVDVRSENYAAMNEQGFLVNTRKGLNINFDFLGNTRFLDATHPDARKFVWQVCKKNYFDQGVNLFWLDEAEPEYGVYDFDNYRYHAGNTQEVGNIYPLNYTQAFYEGLRESGQDNPVSLVRCAWAGSQRYGALVWSGDIHSSFESMRNQICAGLSMGMAGIPWWTTDIGGFHGGNVNDPQFHELLIRWFQWAVFSPVLRMHGHRDPITEPEIPWRDGIAQCNSGAGNELWSFGDETFVILKRFTVLRERLRPYLRELMRAAHECGEPLMRPMFYHYPQQTQSWEMTDQYLFGSDILVAPVVNAGATVREVWLPAGDAWVDANTGQQYSGGTSVTVSAPLSVLPLFVREGAEVLTTIGGMEK